MKLLEEMHDICEASLHVGQHLKSQCNMEEENLYVGGKKDLKKCLLISKHMV